MRFQHFPHTLVFAAVLAVSASATRGAPLVSFSMEEAAGDLVDGIGGLPAVPVDGGHTYQLAGPPGFGNAVALTASGSWRLSVGDSAVLRGLANDFSVAAWIYLDAATVAGKTGLNSQFHRFIGDDDAWDADGWAFGVYTDGRVRFTKNGIVDVDLGAVGTVPQGQWTHVAATVSSVEGTRIYVNGVTIGLNANTSNLITGPGNNGLEDPYAIGRAYGPAEFQWFAGRLDEVQVHDEVLTAAQVQALMTPVRDPALVTDAQVQVGSNGGPQVISIQLANAGESESLVVDEVAFSGTNAGAFGISALPGPIAPGDTGVLEVTFTPDAGGGTYEATMTLSSNDPHLQQFDVSLTVLVEDPSLDIAASVTIGPLPFGPPPTVVNIPVGNTGTTETLEISLPLGVSGTDAANFTVLSAPSSLGPNAQGMIALRFDAAGASGSFGATLEITSNDALNPVTTIALVAEVALGNLDSRLVSHFPFDTPASIGDDIGSFDNDGLPQGDASVTGDARIGSGALLLDGDGDHLLLPGGGSDYSTLDDDGDGFSVAAWVCIDPAATGVMRLISTHMPGGFIGNGWGVGTDSGGGGLLLATTYGVLDFRTAVPAIPPAGEWHHLTYVYRNGPIDRVDFYVDGALVGTTVGAAGMNDTTADFSIGSLGLGTAFQYFRGKLDDLRVYDVEISAADIGAIMAATPPSPLRMLSIDRGDGGDVTITWASRPGRFYVIERSYDFPAFGLETLRNWEELTDSYPADSGETTAFTDSTLTPGTADAYYRVAEVGP